MLSYEDFLRMLISHNVKDTSSDPVRTFYWSGVDKVRYYYADNIIYTYSTGLSTELFYRHVITYPHRYLIGDRVSRRYI